MSVIEASVFVTGSTGTVGQAVVDHLAQKDVPVVAAVRPGKESPASTTPGVTPRAFDFGASPAELRRCLEGCDRVFLMRPPAIEDVRRYLFPLIDAALESGVRQIVFLSLQGVQANRGTPHHAVEAYLRERRAPYTFLRPNFFMQNLSTTYVDRIRARGEIFVPAGRAHTAFIDACDIGRVAAAVFTAPGHIGKAYTLSGEQSLTYAKVAEIMTTELGRDIRYLRPSEKEYLDQLKRDGAPDDYIAVQKMIYRVVRFNISAFPNKSVRKLTGTPATTFAQFVRDYRDAWTPQKLADDA